MTPTPPVPDGTSRRLRIVHLLTGSPEPECSNGVFKAVYHLVEAQAAMGHSVLAQSTVDARTSAALRSAEWRPRVLAACNRLTALISPSLIETLRMARPDIAHFHSIHVPEHVRIAAALSRARIPYCVTVHGALSPEARRRQRMRKTAFGWLCEREYLNRARFVHVLTPDESAHVRAYGVRAPLVLAPNGIDVRALPQAEDRGALRRALPAVGNRRVYLYLGRLDPLQKGLDLLIDAFARAGVADAALVLVGPDTNGRRGELERRARRIGLGDRVFFHDAVFGTTRANFMAAADVFMHPSRWEGVSLAVLEAAAWRKPCVLTPGADPLHVLGRARAAIVAEGTEECLADAIRAAAAMSPEQLRDLGQRAAAAVAANFSWRAAASTLVDAYAPGMSRLLVTPQEQVAVGVG